MERQAVKDNATKQKILKNVDPEKAPIALGSRV
jgi:hypothetical protein